MANQHDAKSLFAAKVELLFQKWRLFIPPESSVEFRADLEELSDEYDSFTAKALRVMDQVSQVENRDALTNLPNRERIMEQLVMRLNGGHQPGTTAVGVVFVDMDKLKLINDRFGHKAGDLALACIAQIIRDSVRHTGSNRTDLVQHLSQQEGEGSRWGGDEFLIVVELADIHDICAFAERVSANIANVERQRELGYKHEIPLHASVGGAACHVPVKGGIGDLAVYAASLIDKADSAMYRGKHQTKKVECDILLEDERAVPDFRPELPYGNARR